MVMVLLTAEQVIARYFFKASSVGLQELEWHLFGAIFLLGAPYTLHCNQHVRVDLLYAKRSPRMKVIIDCLGTLVFLLPMCATLCWFGARYALQARGYASPLPLDYYSVQFPGQEHPLFQFTASIERLLRTTILVGEGSPNPGGLEARWLIKALTPLSFLILGLQSIATFVLNYKADEENVATKPSGEE